MNEMEHCWNDINREKYSEKYLLRGYFPTTNLTWISLKLNPILRRERQDINSLRHNTAWLQHHVKILGKPRKYTGTLFDTN
jgi:hypothetical protein